MAIIVVVSFTFLLLVALLAVRSYYEGNIRNTRKLPPGNMGWPVVGAIFSFLRSHQATTVGDFMSFNIRKYGKIFSTSLMGKLTIVSADAEFNRFVLQNDMRLFKSIRPPGNFRKLFGDSGIISSPEIHKQMRVVLHNLLGSTKIHTSLFQDVQYLAASLTRSWKDGQVIYAADEARKLAFYLIAKAVLNLMPEELEVKVLSMQYPQFSKGLLSLPINFPGTKYNKALQSTNYIMGIIKKKYEERMQKMENGSNTRQDDDLLYLLMHNTTLSCQEICEIVHLVLFSGHETTWKAIVAAMYFLKGCPRAIQQLREEHLHLIRSKKCERREELTWNDYKDLQFTKCVIMETLRLASIGRSLIRKACMDVAFKGYLIPSGANVITHLAAVHLDSSLFENPEQFIPWRWLSSSGINKSNNWMPFGSGPRQCPGMELSKMEMTMFLHHLILNFDWELIEDDSPIANTFIDFPKGMPLKVWALPLDAHAT